MGRPGTTARTIRATRRTHHHTRHTHTARIRSPARRQQQGHPVVGQRTARKGERAQRTTFGTRRRSTRPPDKGADDDHELTTAAAAADRERPPRRPVRLGEGSRTTREEKKKQKGALPKVGHWRSGAARAPLLPRTMRTFQLLKVLLGRRRPCGWWGQRPCRRMLL